MNRNVSLCLFLALGIGSTYHGVCWGQTVRAELKSRSGAWHIAFSQDGKTLASVGQDRIIRLWEVKAGTLKGELKAPAKGDDVALLCFSPDGRALASAQGNKIQLWDVTKGEVVGEFVGHKKRVSCVAFSPDGKTLASGSHDNTIRLWDVESRKEKRSLKERLGSYTPGAINRVCFSPDGETLATLGMALFLWKVATGEEARRFGEEGECIGGDVSLSFSPNGVTLASADTSYLNLWEVKSGKRKAKVHCPTKPVVESFRCISFSPDGKTIATGGDWSKISLYSAEDGKNIATWKGHTRDQGFVGDERILWISFNPADADMLTTCSGGVPADSKGPLPTVIIWEGIAKIARK